MVDSYFMSIGIGFATTILAALVVVFFVLYSKRRFMYVGLGLIGCNTVPLFSGQLGLNPEMVSGEFGFLLKLGEHTSPWLTALFVLAALFSFWLDSKQK